MSEIVENYRRYSPQEWAEKNLVNSILELEDEADAIAVEISKKREMLKSYMDNNGIKTVKTNLALVTLAERSNIKVDAQKAKMFLDSQGIYEEFSKLDETKVKKIYPTAEFIISGEPTKVLTIKKEK